MFSYLSLQLPLTGASGHTSLQSECVQLVFELSKHNANDVLFVGTAQPSAAAGAGGSAPAVAVEGILLPPLIRCVEQSVARGFQDISFGEYCIDECRIACCLVLIRVCVSSACGYTKRIG